MEDLATTPGRNFNFHSTDPSKKRGAKGKLALMAGAVLAAGCLAQSDWSAVRDLISGTRVVIVERTGAPWAKEMFGRMYRYVRDKYSLKSHGSPLWIYASDRQASYEAFLRMPKRVENYHHPRHLMLNLLSLERMIKQ